MKRYLSIVLVLLGWLPAQATHIVGGEIYYDCLGGDNYLITMKIYRDCLNGLAPFDDPAAIGVYTPSGTLVQTVWMASPTITTISNTISVPCYVPAAGSVCEEEAIYTATANIPGSATGYYLVYQRCCRNNTIINLMNPGSQGITLMIQIPPNYQATCNSSPRYNQFPPIYLCNGVPEIFDHSATDPDGDSLAYELCAPFDGANSGAPMPQPPNPPPYNFVVYNAPYSGPSPMSANPALSINPTTGILTGTPNLNGTWVVAVCCKEYRNGVLLSINKRDFQFNVLNCQPIPVTSAININPAALHCAGLTIPFNQSSINASFYHWDFGVIPIFSDTSNNSQPIYTYPAAGSYTVSLVANPGTICSDTDTIHLNVQLPVQPTFTAPPPQCITGNNFNFTAAGLFNGTGTFTWTFGANANPTTSSAQNPTNITYGTWGVFPVTLFVDENGCTGSHSDSVRVYPIPQASYSGGPFAGCAPLWVQFNDASITGGLPLTYLWDFGDGSPFSTSSNPTHQYAQPGSYDVQLIINSANICVVTDTFDLANIVNVYPIPTAGITSDSVSVSVFNPVITFTDQSANGDSCHVDFGDGSASDSCSAAMVHVFPTYGHYTVTQIVYNQYGCADTTQINVEVRPEFRYWMPNTFTPNNDGLNEVYMPSIMGVENYTFRIFDRWGHIIFETHNTYEGWDGTLKGTKCQEGVYVWSLIFDDLPTGGTHQQLGHVNLIR